MKKLLFFIVLIGKTAFAAQCLPVDDNIAFTIPCAQYQGIRYSIELRYFPNSSDSSALYWKTPANTISVVNSSDNNCISVADDLRFYVSCAQYQGVGYRFWVKYDPNPNDPSNLYWKTEIKTFTTIPQNPPSGAGVLPIGEQSYNTNIVYYAPESIKNMLDPGILVYLHGDGESAVSTLAQRIQSDFKAVADEKGLLVIAVQANHLGFQMVDSTGHYMTDDYYNTLDAIILAYQTWAVNPGKTYITGYSAGGPGAVMISRSELKSNIRAAAIWCAPYNAYALIPNSYKTQVPIRVVSNPGDGNYDPPVGNGSFGYWQYFLPGYGHSVEAVVETHISGHQFDAASVRDACGWMMENH